MKRSEPHPRGDRPGCRTPPSPPRAARARIGRATALPSGHYRPCVVRPASIAQSAPPVRWPSAWPTRSTPVLSLDPAQGVTDFSVQIDNDPSFSSAEVTESTKNTRFVPSATSRAARSTGAYAAAKNGDVLGVGRGLLHRLRRDGPGRRPPRPTAPSLPQPDNPPLLRWQTSRGATSYTVEVDGDADFIGAKSYTHEDHVSGRARRPARRRLLLARHGLARGRIQQRPVRHHEFRPGRPPVPATDLPRRRHQPGRRGRRLRLGAGGRSRDLRTPGRHRLDLQQLRLQDREPLRLALLAGHHALQRPVLVAGARRRPGWSAHRVVDRALQLPAPVARHARWLSGPTGSDVGTGRFGRDAATATASSSSGRPSSTPLDTSSRWPTDRNFSARTSGRARPRRRPTPRAAARMHLRPADDLLLEGPPAGRSVPAAGCPASSRRPRRSSGAPRPPSASRRVVRCPGRRTHGRHDRPRCHSGGVVWRTQCVEHCPRHPCSRGRRCPAPRAISSTSPTTRTSPPLLSTPRRSRRPTTCCRLRDGDIKRALAESEAGKPYFWYVRPCWVTAVEGSPCGTDPVSTQHPESRPGTASSRRPLRSRA